MNLNLLTPDHINSFNSVVGDYLSQGFDVGFDALKVIVGVGVFVIVVKILISKF